LEKQTERQVCRAVYYRHALPTLNLPTKQAKVTAEKRFFKVVGWGAEFAFYKGLTLDELKPNEAEGTDGLEALEADELESLVRGVWVVGDEGTAYEAGFEHPEVDYTSEGLVRPSLRKWWWELELDSAFDPKLLSFKNSVLSYDGTHYEPKWATTKGEDELYEV
jgi:hypothetical protein